MDFEHEKNPALFTDVQKTIMSVGDIYPLAERLVFVSSFLKEAGAKDEDMILGYFNECIRLATETRGVFGAYLLTCQLYWHVVQLIKKLDAASQAKRLETLPPDPTTQKPDGK